MVIINDINDSGKKSKSEKKVLQGTGIVIIAVFSLIMMLSVACTTSISEKEAQDSALYFIKSRVKFFTKDPVADNNTGIPGATIGKITSYRDGGDWVVTIHVTTEVNGTIKQADMTVKVDGKSGAITEFNGKPVVL